MIQIKLERIGDDTKAFMDLWAGVTREVLGPKIAETVFGVKSWPSRSWCAEIVGLDPKYHYARRFLNGNRDYREANKTGSRGVYDYFNLAEGHVYEVSAPQSWKRTDRYFCRVDGENLVRMEKEEVEEWLKNHSV